jgi:hypothetical protein
LNSSSVIACSLAGESPRLGPAAGSGWRGESIGEADGRAIGKPARVAPVPKRQLRAGDQQRRQGQAPRSGDLAAEVGGVTIAKV